MKGFDFLTDSILLEKLYAYGFRGVVLDLLISYLGNKQEYIEIIEIIGFSSDMKPISRGMLQASILGPFLFNLSNNIVNIASNVKFVNYADDTSLFFFW